MARYRAIPKVRDLRQVTGAPARAAVQVTEQAAEGDELGEEVSYRDLQEQAKERGIPANQSRADLEQALSDE